MLKSFPITGVVPNGVIASKKRYCTGAWVVVTNSVPVKKSGAKRSKSNYRSPTI